MRHNLFGTWNILTLFCILYSEKKNGCQDLFVFQRLFQTIEQKEL